MNDHVASRSRGKALRGDSKVTLARKASEGSGGDQLSSPGARWRWTGHHWGAVCYTRPSKNSQGVPQDFLYYFYSVFRLWFAEMTYSCMYCGALHEAGVYYSYFKQNWYDIKYQKSKSKRHSAVYPCQLHANICQFDANICTRVEIPWISIDFPSMGIHENGMEVYGNPFSIYGNPWESILIQFWRPFEIDFRDNGFPIYGKSILIDGFLANRLSSMGIHGKSILIDGIHGSSTRVTRHSIDTVFRVVS